MSREEFINREIEKEGFLENLIIEKSEVSGLVVGPRVLSSLVVYLMGEIKGMFHNHQIPDDMFEEVVSLLEVPSEIKEYSENLDYNVNLFCKTCRCCLEDSFLAAYDEIKPPMSQQELEDFLLESMDWELDDITPIVSKFSEIHPFIVECGLVGGSRRKGTNFRRRRRNFKRKKNNGNGRMEIIPRVFIQPRKDRVLRYVATSAGANIAITTRCLLNMVLSNDGTTAAFNVYNAIRIRMITVFFAPTSVDGLGTGAEEISLTWAGFRSPPVRLTDRGTLSHIAYIRSRPPKDSMARMWATAADPLNDTFCVLTVPQYGVIDVHFDYIENNGTARTVVINIGTAITGIGYPALNNAVVGGGVGGLQFEIDNLTPLQMTTP